MIASLVFFGGLAILITWLDAWGAMGTWLDAWGAMGTWFADQSVTTLTVGLPAAIALVAALVAYPGIRRVVP
jgi:hypothetical protein